MKNDPIASTEYIAIRDALLPFRYCDGRPVDPLERNLIGELLQLAEKYNSSGHYIAHELEIMLGQVQRMPKTAPEYAGWFIATIESRLQRRNRATASNLPAVPSQEAAALLAPLMEHSTLPRPGESFPAEMRARQFERQADGNRFEAVQLCIAGIRGSDPLEGQLRLEAALWMIDEGWSREFPKKAPVVEFWQQRDERKKA